LELGTFAVCVLAARNTIADAIIAHAFLNRVGASVARRPVK
jgi:hypothetical protein